MKRFYIPRFMLPGMFMAVVFAIVFDLSIFASLVFFTICVIVWPPSLYLATLAREHFTGRR